MTGILCCRACQKTFATPEEFSSCFICQARRFDLNVIWTISKVSAGLVSHEKVHRNWTNCHVFCDFCPRRFKSERNLSVHERAEEDELEADNIRRVRLLMETAKDARLIWKQRPVRIVVVGRRGAGKTCVINRIMARYLLPSNSKRFSEPVRFVTVPDVTEFLVEDVAQMSHIHRQTMNFEEIRQEIGVRLDASQSPVKFVYHSPMLPFAEYTELPWWKVPARGHETEQDLREADCILVVWSIAGDDGKVNDRELERIMTAHKDKVIGVYTHFDQAGDEVANVNPSFVCLANVGHVFSTPSDDFVNERSALYRHPKCNKHVGVKALLRMLDTRFYRSKIHSALEHLRRDASIGLPSPAHFEANRAAEHRDVERAVIKSFLMLVPLEASRLFTKLKERADLFSGGNGSVIFENLTQEDRLVEHCLRVFDFVVQQDRHFEHDEYLSCYRLLLKSRLQGLTPALLFPLHFMADEIVTGLLSKWRFFGHHTRLQATIIRLVKAFLCYKLHQCRRQVLELIVEEESSIVLEERDFLHPPAPPEQPVGHLKDGVYEELVATCADEHLLFQNEDGEVRYTFRVRDLFYSFDDQAKLYFSRAAAENDLFVFELLFDRDEWMLWCEMSYARRRGGDPTTLRSIGAGHVARRVDHYLWNVLTPRIAQRLPQLMKRHLVTDLENYIKTDLIKTIMEMGAESPLCSTPQFALASELVLAARRHILSLIDDDLMTFYRP